MKITQNMVAALSYELEVEGAIADKADASRPLQYIHGTGMLLPRFEEEVEGKETGDSFEFTLTPEEGYGAYNEEYVFDLPKSAFELDGVVREDLLVPGHIIPMLNSAGEVVQGVVKEVKEDAVAMDFNHPMAGKILHFTGTVVSVREATEKELAEGLHHECHCNGGCHKEEGSCNCGDGGCNCGDGGCNCEN